MHLAFATCLVVIAHVCLVVPFYIWSLKCSTNRWFRVLMAKIILFFTFSFYIRTFIEAFLLGIISNINEIWISGITSSILLLLFWISFCVLYFILWIKARSVHFRTEESYFREFFTGLKDNNISRAYFGVFLLRRVALVLIIYWTEGWSRYIITPLFEIPNLWWMIYYSIVRPFEFSKDNNNVY